MDRSITAPILLPRPWTPGHVCDTVRSLEHTAECQGPVAPESRRTEWPHSARPGGQERTHSLPWVLPTPSDLSESTARAEPPQARGFPPLSRVELMGTPAGAWLFLIPGPQLLGPQPSLTCRPKGTIWKALCRPLVGG